MSETSKYRKLTRPYCLRSDGEPGCGLDIASGGDPVVPWAWQIELPDSDYAFYNSNEPIRGAVQLKGDATQHRASEANCLDFVYSSHLLEDVPEERWNAVLSMWASMLKPGGHLIILVPERNLWAAALAKGQPPNCSHRYEPFVGDVSRHAKEIGLTVVKDELTKQFPGDYTILAVLRK